MWIGKRLQGWQNAWTISCRWNPCRQSRWTTPWVAFLHGLSSPEDCGLFIPMWDPIMRYEYPCNRLSKGRSERWISSWLTDLHNLPWSVSWSVSGGLDIHPLGCLLYFFYDHVCLLYLFNGPHSDVLIHRIGVTLPSYYSDRPLTIPWSEHLPWQMFKTTVLRITPMVVSSQTSYSWMNDHRPHSCEDMSRMNCLASTGDKK